MNELITYISAIIILVLLMVSWALVQALWRRTFGEHMTDTDVLAERRNCGNCGCTTVCTRNQITRHSSKK